MVDSNEILKCLDDIYYVITDEDNNVISFNHKKALEIYKHTVTNSLSIKSLTDKSTEYYLKDSNEWYECVKNKINNMNIKIFKDITKYKIREKNLQIDQTTGLPNKELTDNLLNECIETAQKNKEEFAVLFCDIDFFKKVNDIYGHDCGDKLLSYLGEIFKTNTRQNNKPYYEMRPLDITGRHGGEEFLIVLRNINAENAFMKAEKIRKFIEKYDLKYEENTVHITMTMGLYHVKTEELETVTDIDEFRSIIMRKADIALYEGKRTGRNKVVVYEDDMIKNRSKIKTINK